MASAKSGLWSAPSTWDYGVVPASFNSIIVSSGHVVTIDILNAVSSTATIYGTLMASRATSSSWTLTGGDLNVNAGGILDYGTEASPIPAIYIAHLVLSSGTYAGQYGLIVNNGGNFTVRGAAKAPYSFATANISGTDTQLTVYGSTSTYGWQAGDVITIGPTAGSGTGTTSTRTITGVEHNTGSNIVTWSATEPLGTARTLSSTSPIIIANLTRNVLVRSSGTATGSNTAYIQNLAQNATSFSLTYGEFAYLGASLASTYGITFDGALTRGLISSSTVRNGYIGIFLNSSSSNTFIGNNSYSNSETGISLVSSSNNTFTGNNSYSNSNTGIYIIITSNNNTLIGNNSYSNSSHGIYLESSSNNSLTGNSSYSNSGPGINLASSSNNNTLTGNNSYSNSNYGIYLNAASNNNTLTGNNSYSNSTFGISLYSSSNNTLTGNNSYSNLSYGIYLNGSSNSTFAGGSLGYDGAGSSKPNNAPEIYFEPGSSIETLTLKGTRVNPAFGVSTAGLNTAGSYLLSYNQDADTGTVRIWGNYKLAGSTLTLDYATQLYASTATAPKLMRGTGHSITDIQLYNTTPSELVTVKHAGGNVWTVTGSSSGFLDTVTCAAGSTNNFSYASLRFTLTVGGTLNLGDTLDFVTMAASNDANKQKKLLFGYSATGYNNGRSKLEIADTGGVVLKGNPDGTANTLIDTIAGNSTYYLFVDSGAFTASYSSFTNMGPGGIQVNGNKGFSLGYSNFDYFGFTDASSTNSYITARDLTVNTTVYNTVFGLSRPAPAGSAAWNVHVEGADIIGGLYFRGIAAELGARWGESYDDELGASDKVTWVDTACDPRTSAGGGGLWSAGATWDTGFAPTFCSSVTIRSGDVVTINTLNAVSSNTVINGTVMASRAVSYSWTWTGGDIKVNVGGVLDYGTEASPIPAAYLAHLVLPSGIYAGQHGLIVNDGGNFTVRGSTKTPYSFATASIGASVNSLTVYGSTATDGWQIGDVITIGPTTGSGATTTSSRTITGVEHNAVSNNVTWSAAEPLGTARTLTADTPIIVGNLTRNVLVRSSSSVNSAYILNLAQNATSFALTYGEFAHLGSFSSGKYGITFKGSLTKGSISSSTIRNGSWQAIGIFLENSSTNTLVGNNFYSNTRGIYLLNSSNNILTGNNSYSNSDWGIYLDNAPNNILAGNNSYSNSHYGIYITGSSHYSTLAGNNSYSNYVGGIRLDTNYNTVAGNNSYSNGASAYGFYVGGGYNTLTRNNSYSNTGGGILLSGSNSTLLGNNSYSNATYGVSAIVSSNTFIDGTIGYNAAGDTLMNTTAEINFSPGTPATPEALVLKGTRVNPSVGISTTGMDVAGASLISYNQDYDTGTVRIWGNYQVAGSTLTLDYASRLYGSANTTPKLMRGAGHSITLVTTNDAATLSELITVKNTSGNTWTVTGSSSGFLGTLDCAAYFSNGFVASTKVGFLLTAGDTLNVGDTLDFVTIAASSDTNRQKKLLFGYSAAGYNSGRSKLEIASDAGLVLTGNPDGTANTLIDMIAGNSTYYTFVDSGAFTAAYSSFTNMDQDGIQLVGNKGVAISSSTFDYLGFASGANSYITMRDLTTGASFYNVVFGLSRSSAGFSPVYNVRVLGTDSWLAPVFRKTVPFLGPLWGERYDYDPNAKVKWSADFPAIPGCGTGLTVSQDESSDYTTIQEAVYALPINLSTDTCVVIRDTQTYSEQVTVDGFTNNGYRVKIMADPTFVSSAPAVNPWAGASAAFLIYNDSVTVQGINIISTNTAPYGIYSIASFLNISSVNVISGGKITGAGIRISSYSAVSYSSITVQSAIGLYLTDSNNEVSFSSMASNNSSYSALYLINSDSNTVTRSYISNPSGNAAALSVGADHNTISYSTMTSDSDSGTGLYLYGASSNTVSNSYMLNSGGTGAIADFHSTNNNIVFSTMAGYGYAGLFVKDSLLTTVSNCYMQGSAVGIEVAGSTGTMIGGSVLVSTNANGVTFAEWAGSLNLTLSSSTLVSEAQGWGIWLGDDNSGAIDLSSNTIRGGEFGLNIATQTGGAALSITSMTFQGLAVGATAFNFLGGLFVATFTAVAFNSADMAVNVNGSSLTFGSRITMHQAAGVKSGPDYESDIFGYVDWDGVRAALVAPANDALGISQSPGLHARVLDAAGPVQYNYQLDTIEAMNSQGDQPLHNFNQSVTQVFGVGAFSGQDWTILTSSDSYLYNSTATLAFYSMGTSRLSPNTLYYWRVRAKTADTGYFGVWSATASFITGQAAAAAPVNNLAVTNVSLSSATGLGVTVNFTIRENNVSTGTSPGGGAYNTADWIFVKFSTQAGANGTWNHATLAAGGAGAGGALTLASDKKGVFINHTLNYTLWQATASVVWNYAADGVNASNARVKVFAISMVRVPTGSFVYNAGDASGNGWNTYGGGAQATVANAASLPTGAPTGWPNGYNSFYMGRYEVTQGQYADYLNTIESATAAAHHYSGGNVPGQNMVYFSTNPYGSRYLTSTPNAAKALLPMSDAWSYLSWAGVRPPTEMEFEKAGRDINGDTRQFPWGDTQPGLVLYTPPNEGGTFARKYLNFNHTGVSGSEYVAGVLDVGRYMSGDVYRTTEETGASPWGIADLSGNLSEYVFNCSYTSVPSNGNGTLSWPANWAAGWNLPPGASSFGSTANGFRGGSWFNTSSSNGWNFAISGRPFPSFTYNHYYTDIGVRGARGP
ncbi:MAG: NosD domain-containing protein [Elusimicrobiota bacterium]|nr:NosD domain-containing protein [Elusimicrobiota bacterium]